MSDTPIPAASLSERLAGKWQIPAFVLALALAIGVAVQVKSPDRKIPIAEHLAALADYNRLGMFAVASSHAERLLTRVDLADADRGAITLAWARAQAGRWAAGGADAPTPQDVVSAYDQAGQQQVQLAAEDERNIASAFERMRRFELAVKHYGLAAELATDGGLGDLRQVIQLSIYPLRRPQADIDGLIDGFLTRAEGNPQELLWGLTRRLESLADAGESAKAAKLLARHENTFVGDALNNEYTFLRALNDRGAGRFDEAERVLRELLNRVALSDPVYPKAGWLLGSVVMFDGRAQRPEEAVAIFRDVIASRADRVYVEASRVAMAEALAGMQRYREALAAYREVVAEMARVPFNRLVNPDSLRTSLTVTAERARAADLLPEAVELEAMALGLVEEGDAETQSRHLARLADVQVALARSLRAKATGADAAAAEADATDLLKKAAGLRVKLAWLNTLNEARASEEMWTAAGLFDEAGDYDAAIELLRRFATERADAEVIPQVLLRLGRELQDQGRYAEAVDVYQRNISSFPRSPHANAALIPLAECYMALGEKQEAGAEEALRRIVDNSAIFTPEAPEYRDALFLLADLFSRQNRHEEAIATLDEILQRYPQDVRRSRAIFLIGHARYRSAQAIKDELLKPEFAGDRKRLVAERATRLMRAQQDFHDAIAMLEARPASTLGELEQVYLQESRLYEASCLFELGEFREALALYERAAWLYKESPAALGAYVQVINCDLILGRREDAETALRRAQFLVTSLTDAAFEQTEGLQKRDEWGRYFDWVAQTLTQTEE